MAEQDTRSVYRRGWFWLTAANVALAYLNGYGYIRAAQVPLGSPGWLFVNAALLGQVGAACLLIGLAFLAFSRLWRWGTLDFKYIGPSLFTLLHLFLVVDKQIFVLFRFHFNGLVWNVLTTPGGWESMHISSRDLVLFVLGAVGVWGLEFLLFRWIARRIESSPPRTGAGRLWGGLALAVVLILVTEKVVYAVSDIFNIREVTRNAQVVPFYQPFTIRKFVKRYTRIPVDQEMTLDVQHGSSRLLYPRTPFRYEPPKKLYNIVWIVIDGWRFDTFTPENSPNVWKLGKKSLVFERNFSGGNCTRFGIFGIFYGLYGTYWHSFLNERRGPVLIERLKELGYRLKILSSTSLTFPEFRRTAFVDIPESIEDNLPGANPAAKDGAMFKGMETFASETGSGKPFFGFLFTDGTHAPYDFPKEYGHFKPYSEVLNYLFYGSASHRDEDFNRYRNAVYYGDHLVGELVRSLERRGLSDNTIVMVTGDHGEEFQENGLWGHNGNFSREQIQVPMILYVPGGKSGRVARLTSHHDLVPTFMEMLGVQNPPADYSLGRSLLSPEEVPYQVSCSWDQCALIDNEATLTFGTGSYRISDVEVLDKSYKEVPSPKAALSKRTGSLVQLLGEMGRFLK